MGNEQSFSQICQQVADEFQMGGLAETLYQDFAKEVMLKYVDALWKQYKSKRVIRVLKAGKWEIIEVNGHGVPAITGTRAESKDLKDIMDFPEFMRQQNG